ncbi:unnamed protein product (macronuclear) [Paramecium tetraurelia]|uniref:Uncharacterized protein n=1 Tax=Paramecium tetraurelia TaxID=5888 RepID=A0BT17_PARTE|nr:uncharacterized protein GSPATT00031916001 [Paramecium tetraurelia]CAK61684.1 unnamed protein product [Paramecium tetraurelia]|eukprot:XP_001429082.1 hypothetical protein (macronuclear) [Paramecium tetraurelia strain d4-2]
MNNQQQNTQAQGSIQQINSNQQNQKTEPIKLKQKQHDYSQGNRYQVNCIQRTCMATGRNGIDFYILAKIVQKEHSEIILSAIEEQF